MTEWFEAGVPFSQVLIQFVYAGAEGMPRVWTHDSLCTAMLLDRAPASGWQLAPGTRKPLLDGYLSVRELCIAARDPAGWNEEFDRVNGIPAIQRYVREFLSRDALR